MATADMCRHGISSATFYKWKSNYGGLGCPKPPLDWRLYREWYQIECFFNKLKRFRRIALRYERTLSAFYELCPSHMHHDLAILIADST
ncbi:transposase [Sphingobium sp. B1D3A]|uniref:Transposase n=1 Tax=Sphingobium lignivorans TaxID=2735886 RepID=A0ABR6NI26_9SPHN|nr:transposase [Sphingobium lignivorans]